ncbi:MAG: ComF family protein [Clostridiales bacterium]|nr:ComF family protein [Clostridiales bacterium]
MKKSRGQIAIEVVHDSIFPNKCLFCCRVMDDLREIFCGGCADYAACDYNDEAVRHVIFRFKYEGKRMLARRMAEMIFRSLGEIDADCLVCVPLHEKRMKERGYNQAGLLALELSGLCGVPAYDGMTRVRETARQFDLKPEERAANVAGAFGLKEGFCVAAKDVLLVDDVLTTGATAAECGRVLTEAGAKSVKLAAFARA